MRKIAGSAGVAAVLVLAACSTDTTASSPAADVFVVETAGNVFQIWLSWGVGLTIASVVVTLSLFFQLVRSVWSWIRSIGESDDQPSEPTNLVAKLKTFGGVLLSSILYVGLLFLTSFVLTDAPNSVRVTVDRLQDTVTIDQDYFLNDSHNQMSLDELVGIHYHYTPSSGSGEGRSPASGEVFLVLTDRTAVDVFSGQPDATLDLAQALATAAGVRLTNS